MPSRLTALALFGIFAGCISCNKCPHNRYLLLQFANSIIHLIFISMFVWSNELKERNYLNFLRTRNISNINDVPHVVMKWLLKTILENVKYIIKSLKNKPVFFFVQKIMKVSFTESIESTSIANTSILPCSFSHKFVHFFHCLNKKSVCFKFWIIAYFYNNNKKTTFLFWRSNFNLRKQPVLFVSNAKQFNTHYFNKCETKNTPWLNILKHNSTNSVSVMSCIRLFATHNFSKSYFNLNSTKCC